MSKRQEPADVGRKGAAAPRVPEAAPPAGAAPSSPSTAVGGLMEERRRFEEWLSALEARREATPERVYVRVHADYTTRLQAVVAQLIQHTEGLRAELTRLTARLAELQDEQQHAREERDEAELRAHVGELTPDEWADTAREADERIEGLASRKAEAEAELVRTRELLASAERPATPHLSAAAVPVAPSRGRPSSFDELAFLHSVVDTPGSEAAPKAAAPASPAPPAPLAPLAPPANPVTPIGPPPRGGEVPAPRARKDSGIENSDAAAGTSILGGPARKGTPMAANISGNNPIVLKDKPAENARTLTCADCGAMNFPTEWYCERCGAELASL